MNFYVSIAQLLQTAEGMEKNLGFLAERAFRISPRDSRANREILELCTDKLTEARKLLGENPHLGKTPLRHATLLLQIFRLSFRRMCHLAIAVADPEGGSEDEARAIQSLFATASHHFKLLKQVLLDLAGVALVLEIDGSDVKNGSDLGTFQVEETDLRESLASLEKAIEIFDEEPVLLDALVFIRQELLEARKRIRRFITRRPGIRGGISTPALTPK